MKSNNQRLGSSMSPKALMQLKTAGIEAEKFLMSKVRERQVAAELERLLARLTPLEPDDRSAQISLHCSKLVPEARAEMVEGLIGLVATSETMEVLVTAIEILVVIGPEVVPLVEKCLTSCMNGQQCLAVHRVIFHLAEQLTDDTLVRLVDKLDEGARRYGGNVHFRESHDRVIAKIDEVMNARS